MSALGTSARPIRSTSRSTATTSPSTSSTESGRLAQAS